MNTKNHIGGNGNDATLGLVKTLKTRTILVLTVLLTFISCTNDRKPNRESISHSLSNNDSIAQLVTDTLPKKSDAEQASYFIEQLFEKGADTVLYYGRNCIGCCDFYTVFWTQNGKTFYQKFHYDVDLKNTFFAVIELKNDQIFDELKANYSTLNKASIKQNNHKMPNGETQFMMSSHYCSSLIKVYSKNDSVVSGYMNDYDFKKDSGIENEKGRSLSNDNYRSNIQSKWYTLLTAIENEISLMPETSNQEREVMRKSK